MEKLMKNPGLVQFLFTLVIGVATLIALILNSAFVLVICIAGWVLLPIIVLELYKKQIEEDHWLKDACKNLHKQLREKKKEVEDLQAILSELEKDVPIVKCEKRPKIVLVHKGNPCPDPDIFELTEEEATQNNWHTGEYDVEVFLDYGAYTVVCKTPQDVSEVIKAIKCECGGTKAIYRAGESYGFTNIPAKQVLIEYKRLCE